MVQVSALQTKRALLTLKPYEISLKQIPSALPAGRGGAVQYEHDQIFALFDAGHAGILHRHEEVFNVTFASPCSANVR